MALFWTNKLPKSVSLSGMVFYILGLGHFGPQRAVITEDILKIGSVIQCVMKPVPRLGRDHLEHKNPDRLSETTIQKLG